MRDHAAATWKNWKRTLQIIAALGALAIPVGLRVPRLKAQSAASQTPGQPPTPQWQIEAGGKAKFDVASLKQDASGDRRPYYQNVWLTGTDEFTPTGGLFSVTHGSLAEFMLFAYKFRAYGYYSLQKQLPKWGYTSFYDIEARAPGNPSKDQYRLMMQGLLEDRFKLKAHWEMKQLPVIAVVLDKAGKLGPNLRPHSDDVPCPAGLPPPGSPGPQKTIAGGFPEFCGIWWWQDSGRQHRIARDVPISAMTDYFMSGPADRPYLDKTGLEGNYDIVLEWSSQPGEYGYRPDDTGPSLVEAIKNQLGFKLVREIGPVETLVIDHVEEPSPN